MPCANFKGKDQIGFWSRRIFGASSFSDTARTSVSGSRVEGAGAEELAAWSDDEASTDVFWSWFCAGGAATAELIRKAKTMDAM